MKILVTGGAGFIGSSVIRNIINNTNDSVINIDKLTYAANLSSLKSIEKSSRYFFENIDICNISDLKRVFLHYKPDAVMHLAAETHVDRSILGPEEFINTNIFGTYNLLEVARSYFEELESNMKKSFRFLHISTDEVFGDLPHPSDEMNEPLPLFNEESPYAPSSPYSASKASSDHLVRAWGRTFKMPIMITNCSNNYGPFQFPEKLIPLVIINALRGKSLPIYGKGDQIRDWLYVDDHARALYLVLKSGHIGESYNIGGHNEKQNLEVVYSICNILDELRPNHSNYSEQISFIDDRPGHDRRYAIDSSKMQKNLNWIPNESFESGLRKTVQWYLSNQLWWEQVCE